MCTVAFLPEAKGGYLLGQNRDENRTRSRGLPPGLVTTRGRLALAPRDPDGGGSWIGVNEAGVTLCLLNAAETDPARRLPRPRSRGLVLAEALHLPSIRAVSDSLAHIRALDDVRAFHLVVAEPGTASRPARVGRFCWNGRRSAWDDHEGPCLFVSSARNQEAATRERKAAWQRLLASDAAPDREAVARWLASHEPERGPLSVCMHRREACTVSRTLVRVSGGAAEMAYVDGSPCSETSEFVLNLPLRLG